jgi:Ca2+-binding RTX toxin-like protein
MNTQTKIKTIFIFALLTASFVGTLLAAFPSISFAAEYTVACTGEVDRIITIRGRGGQPDGDYRVEFRCAVDGGGGADVFVFADELTNGTRERNLITGFDAANDVLNLSSDTFVVRDIRGGVIITHSADGDRIYVVGDELNSDNIDIEIGLIDLPL